MFLRYLNFLSRLFGYLEKQLDKMAMLISKFMTSQTGQQIITIPILPNISRNKDNKIMKFGQWIEYNVRHIFLEKSYTKYGGETSPRPFYEKLKLNISLDQYSEMLQRFFLLYVHVKLCKIILKLRCWPLAFTLYKSY